MPPAKKRHHEMVSDPLRTPILEKAVSRIVKKGDNVFDLGCGLGILSFAAARAGASLVTGCDVDDEALRVARKEAVKFPKSHFDFQNELSCEISLAQKADVLLAETVGSLGLDENIVPFVIDARERLLKKGGKIMPERIKVFAAPSSAVVKTDRKKAAYVTHVFSPDSLLAKPLCFFDVNFYKEKFCDFDAEKKFKVDRDGVWSSFAVWFEATWAPGLVTCTSPFDEPTHWKQAYLGTSKPATVRKGSEILFRLVIEPREDNPTLSEIGWGYKA